jgi:hypothetical protein
VVIQCRIESGVLGNSTCTAAIKAASAGASSSEASRITAFEDSRKGRLALASHYFATLGVAAALLAPLAAAARGVIGSGRPAALAGGRAGDVFDDLAPLFRFTPVRRLALEQHPWRFALLCSALVGTAGTAAGWYAEGDLGSGIVRGAIEAVLLLGCFAALGRLLALRR